MLDVMLQKPDIAYPQQSGLVYNNKVTFMCNSCFACFAGVLRRREEN